MAVVAGAPRSGSLVDRFFRATEESDAKEEKKSCLEHVSKWAASTDGAWDIFRIVDQALGYLKMLPWFSEAERGTIAGVRRVADLSGTALSIPSLFSDAHQLHVGLGKFFEARALSDTDPRRTDAMLFAGKKSFYSSLFLANNVSQATLFLNGAGCIQLGATAARCADGAFNVTALVADGAELVEEIYKISDSQTVPSKAAENKEKVGDNTLSYLKIIKDIASVALAVLGLAALASAIVGASFVVSPLLGLGLSTLWLVAKLSAHFYERVTLGS